MRHKLPALAMAAALAASTFGAATAQAAPPQSTTVKYLAVGDSYPAGVGVGTDLSYPALLGAANYATVAPTDTGATGATTEVVLTQLGSGYHVVTVTVGANDVDWLYAIGLVQSDATEQQITQYLSDRLLALGTTGIPGVVAVAASTNPGATILVTGYPHLFGNANKGCSVTPPGAIDAVQVTADQAALVNRAIDALNQTISGSVKGLPTAAKASYVDVVPTFANHGLCDGDPWIQNGSTTGPVAFHPNARGQKAYAQAIQKDGFQKTALTVSRAK